MGEVWRPFATANLTAPVGATQLRVRFGGWTTDTWWFDDITITAITAPAATTTVLTERRYYQLDGISIGTRTRDTVANIDVYHYLLGDIRGSTSLAVQRGTTTVQTQWYTPYGAPRGTPTITATDRGYIGQYDDTTTGLNYLNHRYHDPQTGVFLSVDPLVATTREPYLYGSGNPTTLSDPTGLCAGREGSRGGCGVDYFGGGGVDVNGGTGGAMRCGQGRHGLQGGACNSYGRTVDGTTWSAAANVAPRPGGARIASGYWEPTPASHRSGSCSWNCFFFVGSLAPVLGEAIDAYDCISGSALSCGVLPLPILSGRATRAIESAVQARRATNTADDFANWGGEFVDDAIRVPATRPDFANISVKIERQMQTRGWTPELIDEAVISGEKFPAVNKLGGANTPATRYVSPTTGQSVVIDNATGEIVQVGGPGFEYGAG